MYNVPSWIADFASQHKFWLGPTVKITLALAAAWMSHATLSRVNPRWRRLVWRATAIGCVLITLSAVFPPPLALHVLPPPSDEDDPAAAGQPAAGETAAEAAYAESVATTAAETATPESFCPRFNPAEYYPVAHLQVSGGEGPATPDSFWPAYNPAEYYPIAKAKMRSPEGPAAEATVEPAPAALAAEAEPVAMAAADAAGAAGPIEAARSPFFDWRIWLAIWSVGATWKLIDTLLGMRRLYAIRCRATAVPASIADRAGRMARELGCPRAPEVMATHEIGSPCIMGVWRPVILMPSVQCQRKLAHELPAILFHELAHLRGQDVAWQLVVHALAIVWWFHPLAWRIRVAHAWACDAVCDSVAAYHLGDAMAYGRILARLTIRILTLRAASGMAMAQGSNVRLRIEALERRIFPASLARGPALCAVLVIVSLSGLIGGITLARASANVTSGLERLAVGDGSADESDRAADENAAAEKPTPAATVDGALASQAPPSIAVPPGPSLPAADARPAGGALHSAAPPVADDPDAPQPGMGLVVLDDGGRPVPEANVHFRGQINGEWLERDVATDLAGQARFEMKRGPKVTHLWLTCSKPGLVPVHYLWRGDDHPFDLPPELTLRMEPGSPVTGIVRDENGQPINGAHVAIHLPISWPKLANWVFCAANLKTNAQGRWHWDSAPADLANVNVSVTHPNYLRGFGRFTERENRAQLSQGQKITGRVTDPQGRPVAGATARAGFDHFGTGEPQSKTDDDGRFVLKNCKAGPSIVTVQADAFAPQFHDVVIGQTTGDVDFQLEPGSVVRVRVVDARGNAIRGACFCTDTWRGYCSLDLRLQTDDKGRAEWRGAPADTVLCDLIATGFMSVRRAAIQAGPDETVITLADPLAIRGKVTDAATGWAIPQFGVRQGFAFDGSDQVNWSRDEPTPFEGGLYRLSFDEPAYGRLLEFVAPGYLPAKSRMFESNEGKQTFNVQLERGDGPHGIVLLPDGLPAIGAEVGLATQKTRAYLSAGHFHRGANSAPLTKTDAQGAFSLALPDPGESFQLLVVHDAGFAQVAGDRLAESSEIQLEAWGRIEGRVMLGERPDANRRVNFWPNRKAAADFVSGWDYEADTDADGRFVIERVVPGQGSAARVVVTRFLSGSQNCPCWQVPVDVPAGGSANVTIGGQGRPVFGKVVLDRLPDVKVDWTTNEPATLSLDEDNATERTGFRAAANIDSDGNFWIPDVPAGTYTLNILVNSRPNSNACGSGEAVGKLALAVVVPPMVDGDADEPLDLGVVTATVFDTLEPGEPAPDFALSDTLGGNVRLSDYRGKVVVLNFWATWSRPCVAEMTSLAALQERFKADPRFAMIGLACNQRLEPVRSYVKQNKPAWIQLHAGTTGSRVGPLAESYSVRDLPATFLIGLDGRVLAKNLHSAELAGAITAALADQQSFDAAGPAETPDVE